MQDADGGRALRHETRIQQMDRNWDELLQEFRVTQTGSQILTGLLLTLPFQQRFTELDTYQVNLYLALVVVSMLATALIIAPVSLHRELFRRRLKPELVTAGHRFARAGLVALALVLAGAAMLLFDVVVSRTAGQVAGAVVLVLLVLAWWLLPRAMAARAQRAVAADG